MRSVEIAWEPATGEPIPDSARRLIEVRVGDPYRPLAARQSVRQLFALGRFLDVRVRLEEAGGDAVHVRFELTPRPRVARLRFQGSPPGQRDAIASILGLAAGTAYPAEEPDLAAAEEHLQEVGYLNARVFLAVEPRGVDLDVTVGISPGPRARIASFVAEGVDASTALALRDEMDARPGRFYSGPELEERLPDAIQALRDLGHLSATAYFDAHPGGTTSVAVVLHVDAGPRIEVAADGIPFTEARFRALVSPLFEQGLSEDAVSQARRTVLDELRRLGHRDAEVDANRSESEDGRAATVRFVARPGPAFVLASASATGVPPDLEAEIEDVLSRLRDEVGGPFRRESVAEAASAVRRVLRDHGHYLAEASPEDSVPPGAGNELPVVLAVRPGPRAVVAAVRFEGQGRIPSDELAAVAGVASGDPYVAAGIENARALVEARYRNEGFLDAAVGVEAPMDRDVHAADVTFRIFEGGRVIVGQVIVAGLVATRESVVRGLLPFAEGEALSGEALLETRRRLAGTGLFRVVEVEVLDPEEPVPDHNVLIRLVEGSRIGTGYGFGYNQRETVRGEAEVTWRNVFGVNHTMSLFGRYSLRGHRFVGSYQGARRARGVVPFFLTAYHEGQDRESFDFVRSGVGVQTSRAVLGRRLFLRYNFTRSRLSDVQIDPGQIDRDYAENLFLSGVSVSVVSDTRDDPVNPTRGRFGITDLDYSSDYLGSRAPFVKGLLQQFVFLPLGGDVVFAAGARAGVAWTIGEDEPVLVPLIERFFAGGATTHRGFSMDRAGPLDAAGLPVGGNMMAIANLELRFPIYRSLGGALFSDHGGVYGEVQALGLDDLEHAVGAGLRFGTPFGPVRFDYGIRLGEIGDASRGQWHFTIGHAF